MRRDGTFVSLPASATCRLCLLPVGRWRWPTGGTTSGIGLTSEADRSVTGTGRGGEPVTDRPRGFAGNPHLGRRRPGRRVLEDSTAHCGGFDGASGVEGDVYRVRSVRDRSDT